MSKGLLMFVAFWRLAWYSYLVWHSLMSRRYRDMALGVILILLAFIAGVSTRPVLVVAAFVVAPLLSITIVEYQKRLR